MNSADLMTAIIALLITFTIGTFLIFQIYDVRPHLEVIKEDNHVQISQQKQKQKQKQKEKKQKVDNLKGDGFYNKLMAMHEMKVHHTLCENMLSNTTVKMNLPLEDIIKIRSYIRIAEHRMRKYMKKASPHQYGEVLRSIYYNYDNSKIWVAAS